MSTIGERIRNTRKSNNLKQKELCKIANITESSLSRYEKGFRIPKADNLSKIANALNVPIEFLLGDDTNAHIHDSYNHNKRINHQFKPALSKMMSDIQYSYIKDVVSTIKKEFGKDVYRLACELSLNISTLESNPNYNFMVNYNYIGGKHFIFLNPNIQEEHKTAAIAHIIGYTILSTNSNYYIPDFINSDNDEIGLKSNIFAAEFLIDDSLFIKKLTLGSDDIIAEELNVPINFIEHKRNLIIR